MHMPARLADRSSGGGFRGTCELRTSKKEGSPFPGLGLVWVCWTGCGPVHAWAMNGRCGRWAAEGTPGGWLVPPPAGVS